jgi:hypothetical protein
MVVSISFEKQTLPYLSGAHFSRHQFLSELSSDVDRQSGMGARYPCG